MASGNYISCGPCMFDDVKKNAGRWCTNCEEGLCEDCENLHRKSKISRNHKVITIEDYRKIEHVSISQVCEHHGENLEWFCKSHDEALCVVCVPSKHKACSDVIPISIYSANSRQSSALSDLEEMIHGTLRNVKQCIKNRESATKELEKQELAVKTMVLETRIKLNGQLDKLQEKLLHELRSTSQTCKSKYVEILQKLKSTEEMLTKLREQTLHMKQFSSDIQVFLGTRQGNRRVVSEIESIKEEIGDAKNYELNVSIHSKIEKLVKEVDDFGQIQVSEVSAKLDFRGPKIDQAQIRIKVPSSRNIADIKLQCIGTFKMRMANHASVRDCIILPNGHVLMVSNAIENQLIEYSNTGEHIQDIQVSAKPNLIAMVDLNRIVVTYGEKALFLEIMNSNTFNIEKQISLQNSCTGISYADGKLCVMYGKYTIQAIDLSGKELEAFKIESNCLPCIKMSREKIFYADYDTKQVHCCRLTGEELWKFECDSIKFPYDITIDSYNNVYVVDYVDKNLTIIQHDGKDSKTLLSESDGLNCPTCVDYNKDTKTLIVCNKDGKVAIFNVI
ncbi:Hypothetical predicted protein [Mytilus galloprovincialis]|uniref:B box-type domain-containing protein n=1 Tax=Mytilus galloprovincialis TaxID=29158 RepID=A0A8B6ED45_MYTGA|nr:Hypothetical predicted protein [Mytilus galloprovincialis]